MAWPARRVCGSEIGLEAGHHRDDHDQGHDPYRHPGDRQVGDERNEGLLLLGPQVPPADESFKDIRNGVGLKFKV